MYQLFALRQTEAQSYSYGNENCIRKTEKNGVDIQQKTTLIPWNIGDWSWVIMGFKAVISLEDKRGLILNVLKNRIEQWNRGEKKVGDKKKKKLS